MTAERLHTLFVYVEETGELVWRPRGIEMFKSHRSYKTWNTRFSGRSAGHITDDGYVRVTVCGTFQQVHRIVWIMHCGPIPADKEIDHVNGVRNNNRRANLRLCRRSQNNINTRVMTTNPHKVRGVYALPSGYRARIRARGRQIYLGVYPTVGLAAVSYAKASLQHFGKHSPFYSQ